MDIQDYLVKLGWDSKKWTVLKDDEWQPLSQVSGWQNNVFDAVKDPVGRQAFGKNARIVNREWMNKNMASVVKVEAEVPAAPVPDAPPAPPTPPSVP
jgi:hypothetical protein